jgi:NADH-quinone oxidoreductase subunit E
VVAPLSEDARQRLAADAKEIVARYPQPRSALLPMLHLVQSEQGFVSEEGIEFCAGQLGLTAAQVAAVATFYTMYKSAPVGDYHVGVCTNTLCAVMGGDAIFSALQEHLGVGNDETTADGKVTLEHVECNAACDYAPVVMVNWEFFDNQTPQGARELVDALRDGTPPKPTRGATLCTFKEMSRVLAGFPDGRANEGPAAGPATLVGLEIAQHAGGQPHAGGPATPPAAAPAASTASVSEMGRPQPSSHDSPAKTAASDPAHPAPAAKPATPTGSGGRDAGGRPPAGKGKPS